MKTPSLCTIVAFLTFAVGEISAQDSRERLEKLPICAQACITTAFAACKCKILDFTCACTCRVFRPSSESCSNTSCSQPFIKPMLDALDGSCAAITSPIAKSLTPSATVSSSSTPQTDSITMSLITELPSTIPIAKPSGLVDSNVFDSSLGRVITDPSVRPSATVLPGPSLTLDVAIPPGATLTTLYFPGMPTAAVGSKMDESIGIPITPTTPLFPYTTTASHPTHSYCFPIMNGTWSHKETGTGWNRTSLCEGFPGSSYTGGPGIGTPWNRTATQISYTGSPFTGGVTTGRAQERSIVFPGVLLVLSWVMT